MLKYLKEPTKAELKQVKLSPHFTAFEIFYSNTCSHITLSRQYSLQKVQLWLAQRLCNEILEIIRARVGKPIIITGGARDEVVYKRLLANSIKPSPTSDHFFMSYWSLGVGAIDFTADTDLERLFHWIKDTFDYNSFGQVIWYPDHNFIHISNPKTLLGKIGRLVEIPPSRKVLIYKNGEYKPI